VVGSSAGSGCALMVALGCSADEITDFSGRVNFNEFLDHKWGVFRDAKRVMKEYGIYAGAKLRDFYASVAKEKVGDGEITFKQLKEKTGMDLTITGSNVNRNEVAYFNAKNTPDMPCADAVRISSSIPFFFAAVEYDDDIYVDGGTLNNFAVDLFDTIDAHGRRMPNPNVLGILLTSAQELKDWKENEGGGVHVATMVPGAQKGPELKSIMDFGVSYASARTTLFGRHTCAFDEESRKIVRVNTEDVNGIDFDFPGESKKQLINNGYHNTLDFLEQGGFKRNPSLSARALQVRNAHVATSQDGEELQSNAGGMRKESLRIMSSLQGDWQGESSR